MKHGMLTMAAGLALTTADASAMGTPPPEVLRLRIEDACRNPSSTFCLFMLMYDGKMQTHSRDSASSPPATQGA